MKKSFKIIVFCVFVFLLCFCLFFKSMPKTAKTPVALNFSVFKPYSPDDVKKGAEKVEKHYYNVTFAKENPEFEVLSELPNIMGQEEFEAAYKQYYKGEIVKLIDGTFHKKIQVRIGFYCSEVEIGVITSFFLKEGYKAKAAVYVFPKKEEEN